MFKLLENIGVKDNSNALKLKYPDMPSVFKGWKSTNAFFKWETPTRGPSQTNIGLGNGTALDIFNNNIWAWRRVD